MPTSHAAPSGSPTPPDAPASPTVEIWPTAGLPTVFAEWPSDDADAPVVLVYGHHDVQPVDPLELWHTDPFDPTVDGDVLRARGASDDKGQLLFHLLGLRAHLAATGRTTPAVTLKLLIEGEEESGSPNFEKLLAERRDPPRRRRRRHHRHRHDRRGRAEHRDRHARHGRLHGRLPRPRPRPALRRVRRRRPEPRDRDRAPRRGAARRGRTGAGARVLRRRARADRRPSATCSRRFPTTTPSSCGRAVARAQRRKGLLDPGADRRPAHRGGQRHRRRLPGRRPQDDHPERRVRQAVVPPRRRPGPGQGPARRSNSSSPSTRRRASPPTSSGRATASRACLVPIGTPAYNAARRRDQRARSTAGRCCPPAKAAAGPKPRCSRPSARRWCSSASACPTTRSTRRTRRSTSRCCTRARRPPPCCGRELRRARTARGLTGRIV